jgi:multiple sugar transport system permease protein/cellobiose transport system permease protein
MKNRNPGSPFLIRLLLIIVSIIIMVTSVFPFYFMLVMGTYKNNELFRGFKVFFGNYAGRNLKTLASVHLERFYFNSLFVSLTCSVLTVFICAMAGYALSKYHFKGRAIMFNTVLLTMMVPAQVSLVGFIIEMNKLGWLNSHLPLIIPPAASAFGVYWIRQYTLNAIPDSVIESGRIDGCGEFRIFIRIACPFMMPAIFTLVMLSFLWSWNSFFIPMIILSSPSMYTIPVGIRMLATQYRADIAAQILGLSISTIPILAVFGVFSKNLITGLASAAVKE